MKTYFQDINEFTLIFFSLFWTSETEQDIQEIMKKNNFVAAAQVLSQSKIYHFIMN